MNHLCLDNLEIIWTPNKTTGSNINRSIIDLFSHSRRYSYEITRSRNREWIGRGREEPDNETDATQDEIEECRHLL